MLKKLCKQILLSVSLLIPLSLSAASFNKIVVFGDSLSDNGNLASLPDYDFLNSTTLYPYQHGFNNGLPAVEQLAKLLNLPLIPTKYFSTPALGNNFAVAGARAAGNNPIDLQTQVAAFLAGLQNNPAPADALYVVFIGGNDIRDMRDKTNEADARAILTKAGDNIKNTLLQLLNAGATHFLVVNSPDIGKIPETKALAAAGKSYLITKGSQKTWAFNKKLAETVRSVEKLKNVDIVLFDLLTFFNNVVNNGSAYHFTNTTQPCFSSVNRVYYPFCNANQLDSFVFFDEIHPSQRVHERLGRAFFATIPEAN